MKAIRHFRRFASGHVARGTLVSMAVRVVGLGLSFLQAVITARLLGPSAFGTIAIAISIAQVGATLTQLGFGSLAVRKVAQRLAVGDVSGVRSFVRNAIITVGCLSLVSSGIPFAVLVFSGVKLSQLDSALLMGGVMIAPLSFLILLRGIAQGQGKVALAQWPSEVMRPGLLVAVLVAIAIIGLRLGPLDFLGLVILSSTFAAAVACVLTLRGLQNHDLASAPITDDGRLVLQAAPFLGITLVSILHSEMATLMLGALASSGEAGLYQPVARLAPLIALPMNAAAMSFTPRLARLWQCGERERAINLTWTFTIATFTAGALVFGAMALFAPAVLWLFGPEFAVAAPMLRLYAAGMLVVAACGPAGAIVTMIGRSHHALAALIAGALLQAVLGFVLIPSGGAFGATIAVTAGTLLTWIAMLAFARKVGGFDPSLITAVVHLRRAGRKNTASQHD